MNSLSQDPVETLVFLDQMEKQVSLVRWECQAPTFLFLGMRGIMGLQDSKDERETRGLWGPQGCLA